MTDVYSYLLKIRKQIFLEIVYRIFKSLNYNSGNTLDLSNIISGFNIKGL